ncbi:MAG: hypothetical protein CVT98_06510 [Bacteroidetes bacterium HGW-Bacteroidetes-15]|nr:MAG: hypothetical protein CVT98_06510 [Bacteroidetes bacterium HGW-Bacteroidetes-15]
MAIGLGVKSQALGSYAIGVNSTASGNFSMAIGENSIASGFKSYAFGSRAEATQSGSFALGSKAKAMSANSIAIGIDVTANSGDNLYPAFAFGRGVTATGVYAMALGLSTSSSGYASVAMGEGTVSSSLNSSSFGYLTQATGRWSTAMGFYAQANNDVAFSAGRYTTASGRYTTAFGDNTSALSAYEMVVGRYNTTYTPVSTTGWSSGDRLFVIGNGTGSGTRSDAFTVLKNGNVGIGTSSPSDPLNISASAGVDAFRVQVDGTTRLRVFGNGSVAIGSNSEGPVGGLRISGSLGMGIISPTYRVELPNNTTESIGRARANAWITYSDRRVKSNINKLPYGLNEIMQLTPLSYFQHNSSNEEKGFKVEDNGSKDIGLIAQDVYGIIPEVVVKPKDEENDLWSMSYEKLVPVLIKAMQEQQEIIEGQNNQLEAVKSQNEELIKRLEAIEQTLSGSRH